MELIKTVEKQADGSLTGEYALTPEQSSFLINYAISMLLTEGLITVKEGNEEDLLSQIPVEEMGNA